MKFRLRFIKEIVMVSALLVVIGTLGYHLCVYGKGEQTSDIVCCSNDNDGFVSQKLEEFKSAEISRFTKLNSSFPEFLSDGYADQRRLIFESVEEFVDTVISEDIFADVYSSKSNSDDYTYSWSRRWKEYCSNFLETDCKGKIGLLNADDFEMYIKNPGVIEVYKLVEAKRAEKLRQGKVSFDANIQGNGYDMLKYGGLGFYITDDLKAAKKARYCESELTSAGEGKENRGRLIKMAFNSKKANIIDLNDFLCLVRAAFLEYYLKLLFERKNALGYANKAGFECGDSFNFLDRLGKDLKKAMEYGFNYFKYDQAEREEKLKDWLLKNKNKYIEDSKITGTEIEDILNFGCDLKKILISTFFENPALIAKFLEYDAISYDESVVGKGDDESCAKTYIVLNCNLIKIYGEI